MNDLKVQRQAPTTAQQIDSLVNQGAEALSKLTPDQRRELVGELPTDKDRILAGIGPRLQRATLSQLTTWVTEGQIRKTHPLEKHAGAMAEAKERVEDFQLSTAWVEKGRAKSEMAGALAAIVSDAGVTVKDLDSLVKRLELIADIQAAGHLKTLPRPLVGRLNTLTKGAPIHLKEKEGDDGKLSVFSAELIRLVRVELERIAYDSLRKRVDVPQPPA